ncbi:hypothetical protein EYZ11_011212 [Aspergillus tanneri]|uniref:Uncharacterized protein n=1 Tax=Aspergillus tanneri TaxID=1220188 RepID=A0A4S3J3Q6_9EURO|nr:uncharacterized protein ATNIH1004_001802 [Aspergillus tanneri]KAA8652893.1 hypothetical protein ATNIH1004_001802 [Aspergillus tanneri]THC89345.1 hypothetical protein EYZ11_011212 [Aspergillus tanneri]
MSGLYGLLFTKLTLPPSSAINGKTILITGANTGLGREAARHALALGATTVIIGVRSLAKGEVAKTNIESSTSCTDKNKVLVWPVDLSSFTSVQAFAARVRQYVIQDGGRLDMAIMNAGVASLEWAVTPDGWERQLQVNVLSTALLSLELLPVLLRTREQHPSSRPHLAILASDNHKSVKFPDRNADRIFPVLNNQERWKRAQAAGGPTERYGVTKLMDIFITMELAQLVPRDQHGEPLVVVNCLAPGFCKSDLLTREKVPWILKLVQALAARTVQEGSKTLLHAVTQGVETHGKWLDNQAIAERVTFCSAELRIQANRCGSPGPIVTDPDQAMVREKVWGEILAILRGVDHKIRTEY